MLPNGLLIELVNTGKTDTALDILYDAVDVHLRDGRFLMVNAWLKGMENNVENVPVNLLLGALTATLPAKSKLKCRVDLAAAVRKLLEQRGDPEVEKIMRGLE